MGYWTQKADEEELSSEMFSVLLKKILAIEN